MKIVTLQNLRQKSNFYTWCWNMKPIYSYISLKIDNFAALLSWWILILNLRTLICTLKRQKPNVNSRVSKKHFPIAVHFPFTWGGVDSKVWPEKIYRSRFPAPKAPFSKYFVFFGKILNPIAPHSSYSYGFLWEKPPERGRKSLKRVQYPSLRN